MPAIGEWVIDEACRAAATWPEPITVALNISPKQIIQPALPNIVSEALARHKLAGNRIELEVTEGVFLGDNGSTLDVLKRLRALGVGIALDDFGTGYSSIGYLNKAIFHKLKIDGSFVREAGSRPENVAIIQSIVQLAKSFRMSVTAEGVETAEDFERMRDLGCDTIQGYLFGKPLAYERANQMVHRPRRQADGRLDAANRRVGISDVLRSHSVRLTPGIRSGGLALQQLTALRACSNIRAAGSSRSAG